MVLAFLVLKKIYKKKKNTTILSLFLDLLEEGMVLHLYRLELSFPKDALW